MPSRPSIPPASLPALVAAPLVITRGDRRTLEFEAGNIQSEMRVSDPTRLVLAYCRAIMCFTLFVPRPRHILMVGLGGGSLAKFCHRHFPQARITVLELRADVIALRAQFGVPPDDARFQVIHADAVRWLAASRATADVLLVDGFDAGGLPPALGSARFYRHCRRVLADDGVLVTNMFSYDRHTARRLTRLGSLFGGRTCCLADIAGNNQIVFAVKPGNAAAPASHALRMQGRLARRAGLGSGLLNRWLARAVVAWLGWRSQ